MTESELLEALRAAIAPTRDDDPGLTREEIANLMGHTENWASKNILKPLAKSGKLIVGRRKSLRSDGVGCWLPVYRVA
jgi:predicted transcriptional regulator